MEYIYLELFLLVKTGIVPMQESLDLLCASTVAENYTHGYDGRGSVFGGEVVFGMSWLELTEGYTHA